MATAVRDPMARGVKINRALRHWDNRERRNRGADMINGGSSPIRKSRSFAKIAALRSRIAARGNSPVSDSEEIFSRRISRSVLRGRMRLAIPDRRAIRNSDAVPDSNTIHLHSDIHSAAIRRKASPALRTRAADLISAGISPVRNSRSATSGACPHSRSEAGRSSRAIHGIIGWRKMIAVQAMPAHFRRGTTGRKFAISTDRARRKSPRNSAE